MQIVCRHTSGRPGSRLSTGRCWFMNEGREKLSRSGVSQPCLYTFGVSYWTDSLQREVSLGHLPTSWQGLSSSKEKSHVLTGSLEALRALAVEHTWQTSPCHTCQHTPVWCHKVIICFIRISNSLFLSNVNITQSCSLTLMPVHALFLGQVVSFWFLILVLHAIPGTYCWADEDSCDLFLRTSLGIRAPVIFSYICHRSH